MRIKLEQGWRVDCAHCGNLFDVPYRINATRAAKPKFCSDACWIADKGERAKAVVEKRFWSLVDIRGENECWEWKGHRRPLGYGWFNFLGKPMNASRAAYIITTGTTLGASQVVCHSCDNPPCCNPGHLWLGTQADNTHDMMRKGRKRVGNVRRGEAHQNAKLTADQAVEAYRSNEPVGVVAKRLGVTPAAIDRIRRGRSWGHATGAPRR